MRTQSAPTGDAVDRVRHAKVLVELGRPTDAERELAEALDARSDDDEALALLTKIKHMKGELSLALAGWSELHARARRRLRPTARLRLAALLHIAQQPPSSAQLAQQQRHSPMLVELAPPRLQRRPEPYLELEHAFRVWLQRRPTEARARCRMFALLVRGSDAELYKLAVLAEAWMAEHAGDLLSACALLEELGKERAFTADVDRVLALAPLYERVGTRPCLEAAAHIYRFLARDGDDATRVVTLGHLVSLYERLGDGERARAAEREHIAAFHASMLRPALDELAGSEAVQPRRHALGRALAASVYAFPGGAREGLIHEIWAGKEPVAPGSGGSLADEHIFGNLTPEMHKDVKSTFLAVREYARAKLPERTAGLMDFRYTYKVTKEDEPSGGASAGLPTALAFLSLFTGAPLPQDLAATGQIVTDAHDVLTVHGVGDVPYKMRAACHRNLRALVAPEANRVELMASPLVPRAVSVEIGRFVSTFEDAVRHVFGDAFFG